MDVDKTVIDIAQGYQDHPAVADALTEHYRRSNCSLYSFGCWGGRFRDFFDMLAMAHPDDSGQYRPNKLKDMSASILWMPFMNLTRDEVSESDQDREAANIFLGPITEALIQKMKQDDWGSLTDGDVIQLHKAADDARDNSDWISEENKFLFKTLSSEAVKSWLRVWKQNNPNPTVSPN